MKCWTEMFDGMKVQKSSSYFCQIVVFQCLLRIPGWIFSQNIAREHFYPQASYEFVFILSDIENGKNMGRIDSHG